MGGPDFRTVRLLNGRALASDTFEKGSRTGRYPNPIDLGIGRYHHRDGYNVLYSDYHGEWYGDPERKIICWPAQDWGAILGSTHELGHNINLVYSSWIPGTRLSCGRAVWHWFDQRANIDVNHPDDIQFGKFP
jgi:hypothetical protein